jgi:hypothetical protein
MVAIQLETADLARVVASEHRTRRVTQGFYRAPSVKDILRTFPYLPQQTSLLGLGEDGYPVIFDLLDASPGSLLICGDAGCGKTALLKTMLESAILLSSPYQLRSVVLSTVPEEWEVLRATYDRRYFEAVHSSYSDDAVHWIKQLMIRTEQRRYGRELGAVVLLLIDDLEQVLRMDAEVRDGLLWMIREGAANKIWTVATLNSHHVLEHADWIHAFQTHLLGRIGQSSIGQRVSRSLLLQPSNLAEREQFAVRISGEWKLFWAPAS